jgi:Protein of unknown function (DUF3309)
VRRRTQLQLIVGAARRRSGFLCALKQLPTLVRQVALFDGAQTQQRPARIVQPCAKFLSLADTPTGHKAAVLSGRRRRNEMGLGTILLIILVLMLLGVIPTWPHSKSWGYRPSGALGLILIVVVVLLLMGRL